MTRLRRFLQLSAKQQRLLLEGVLLLAAAQVATRVLNGRRLTRYLGQQSEGTRAEQPPGDVRLAEEVGWAIAAAARQLPTGAVCLPQALAARWMLKRRRVSSTLYLGVARAEGPLAHAWVRVGDVIVSGADDVQRYTVVSTFM